MLERIDKVVFYFTVDCAICHNLVNVSHVVVMEKQGLIDCSLCGKQIKFPNFEKIGNAAKDLNDFLGDIANCKFVKLTLNDKFKMQDNVPAAAH